LKRSLQRRLGSHSLNNRGVSSMRLLTLALCSALFSTVLFGQAGTGVITGTVTDPAGAVVPNTPVEVKNAETNVAYPSQTTDTGAYTVPRLPPGKYVVSVV